jgi:hypothetical protein
MFLKVPEPDLLLGSKSGRIYTEAVCATVDEVINNNNQKLSAASVSGADILDMETYSIIKNLKNLKNKSFACIRTISDDSENNLPDFVNFFSNYYPASGLKAFPGYYFTLYLKDFFKFFAALILKPVNIRRFFMFLKNISFAEKTLSMAIEKLMKKY